MAKNNTTTRIRMRDWTCYTTSQVASDLGIYLLRNGNMLLVRKGEYDNLLDELRKIARITPDKFSTGSVEVLLKYDKPFTMSASYGDSII